MRAVSFVERLELEFSGNIAKDALTLGDVDNDQGNELIVGNLEGELAIYKGHQRTPWAKTSDLGMIASLAVGNIFNDDKNYLICIGVEGWCNIFSVSKMQDEDRKKMCAVHTQRIPANTKVSLLADIDGDGAVELIVGLTDRVLRTYRWAAIPQTNSTEPKGKLVGLHKWEFADQIGTISLNPTTEGGTAILVAQPGGTYVKLECSIHDGTDTEQGGSQSQFPSKLIPQRHALASSRMRNPNITTEIMGGIHGIRNGESTNSLLSVATLDGTLMLVDQNEILWSLQVDHQLFALRKLDLTSDQVEEVVACAWDGQTYIVNQDQQSVRFQFEEPVCAFTAGYYTLNGQSVPCLVYATFSNRIFLYHNIKLPPVRTTSLHEEMMKQKEVPDMLKKLNIDASDSNQVREVYKWLLYGYPVAKIRASKADTMDSSQEVRDFEAT